MIYFIDEKIIKDTTPVQNNVDMQNVEQNIEPIFDMIIKYPLGTYFTVDLLDRYQIYKQTNNPAIFNAYETNLIKLIKKTMSWHFAYNSFYDLSWQMTNKGVVAGSADNYQVVQDPTIKFKADRALERSEHYKRDMEKYVCDNIEFFPKFTNELNKDKTLKCNCGCSFNGESMYVSIV